MSTRARIHQGLLPPRGTTRTTPSMVVGPLPPLWKNDFVPPYPVRGIGGVGSTVATIEETGLLS